MISSNKVATAMRITLRDNFAASGHTYADEELVAAINSAIKYCGAMAWAMTVKVSDLALTEGFVQLLPDTAARLNNVLSNALEKTVSELVGLRTYGGTAPVQLVTPDFINTMLRNSPTPKQVVTMFAPAPDTPSAFLVFPPNDGTGKLKVSYRTELPEVSTLGTDDIDISNLFEGAITSYALHVMLSRDGNDSPLAADGKTYLELCTAQLAALQPPAKQ